jgi:hypothetical protein
VRAMMPNRISTRLTIRVSTCRLMENSGSVTAPVPAP